VHKYIYEESKLAAVILGVCHGSSWSTIYQIK